jgi:sugar/nucleoside kinase (ribokinase family)
MEILLIGRILKDHFLAKDVIKCGGNILNVATYLAKDINPKSIHLISSINPHDTLITDYINDLQINFYNVPTSNTPIISYDASNKVEDVNLYDIENDFNVENIKQYTDIIKNAKIIVCDMGNVDIINYVIKTNPKAYLILEPISHHYVKGLSYFIINNTFIFKGNRKEIETITRTKINNLFDCELAVTRLKELGLKRAFITLDKDGVYYYDELKQGYIESKIITSKNLVGAGDIFLSGVLYALRTTKDIEILADYGTRQIKKVLAK